MPQEKRPSSTHGTRTFTLESLTAALEQVQALNEISADLIAENVFGQPAQQGQGEPVAFEIEVSGYTTLLARTHNKADATAAHYRAVGHTVDIRPLGPLADRAEVERLRCEAAKWRGTAGRLTFERNNARAQVAERGQLLQGVVNTNALLWDDVFSTAESIDLHHRIEANLSASAEPSACAHNWVDARNDHIHSGELCSNCLAARAGNLTSQPSAPVEIDERAEFGKALLGIPYLNEGRLDTAEKFWMARAALASKGDN
jgi:hypothetical protein